MKVLRSDLHNERNDHRFAVEFAVEVAVEGAADGALDGMTIRLAARNGFVISLTDHVGGVFGDDDLFRSIDESARDDVGIPDEALALGVRAQHDDDHAGRAHHLAVVEHALAFAGAAESVDDDILDEELLLTLAGVPLLVELQNIAVHE